MTLGIRQLIYVQSTRQSIDNFIWTSILSLFVNVIIIQKRMDKNNQHNKKEEKDFDKKQQISKSQDSDDLDDLYTQNEDYLWNYLPNQLRVSPETNLEQIGISSQSQGDQKPQIQDNQNLRKDENKTIMCGYLQIETRSLFNKWQVCYCILTQSKFYCFENQTRIKLLTCVNFDIYDCEITRKDMEIRILISQFPDPIVFKAYTEKQVAGWFSNVSNLILYYKNNYKIKYIKGNSLIYQNRDVFTEKQFLRTTQSGDILLMTTSDPKCALQRFVTNSQYDHVGMVVKFGSQVKIFQSNPNDGVNVYDWDRFNSEFHYQKIAFRSLEYSQDKREELHKLLVRFAKNTIGKKYDLNAIKLLRRTSSQDETQRGYFCSQLAAKVYKKAGLLANDKASNNYWPMDFTERGALNLLQSASLSQERLIILNKHIKY